MENYRKRQRRLAEEQIASSREQVLGALLEVADNLSRVLDAREADVASLREGVKIILQSVRKALDREGVHSIQAEGQPFDPAQHEAVATIPHQTANVQPHTVVEVLEKGYRLGERILRPARVIVAV
jgi:molecular chaperone GrpE